MLTSEYYRYINIIDSFQIGTEYKDFQNLVINFEANESALEYEIVYITATTILSRIGGLFTVVSGFVYLLFKQITIKTYE